MVLQIAGLADFPDHRVHHVVMEVDDLIDHDGRGKPGEKQRAQRAEHEPVKKAGDDYAGGAYRATAGAAG